MASQFAPMLLGAGFELGMLMYWIASLHQFNQIVSKMLYSDSVSYSVT